MEPHTKVGMISTVNKVPPMLTPEMIKDIVQDDEEVQCKSAQVDLSESKSKQAKVDPEEILQEIDLLETTGWDSAEQWHAYNLICEYAYMFSENDLHFGKTSIVKHSNKLTDST